MTKLITVNEDDDSFVKLVFAEPNCDIFIDDKAFFVTHFMIPVTRAVRVVGFELYYPKFLLRFVRLPSHFYSRVNKISKRMKKTRRPISLDETTEVDTSNSTLHSLFSLHKPDLYTVLMEFVTTFRGSTPGLTGL